MSDGVGRAVAAEVVDCELDEGGVAVRDLETAKNWARRDESVSTMFCLREGSSSVSYSRNSKA